MKSLAVTRSAWGLLGLSLVGSGGGGLRLAAIAGEAKPAAIAAVAAGSVAAVGGLKLLAKTGAASAGKIVVGKGGLAAAAKLGVGSAGGREGLIKLSEYEARGVLNSTATSAFRSRPELLSPDNFPDLFRRYPRLSSVRNDASAYEAFLADNPKFLDEASLALYRRNPALFAERFEQNRVLGFYQDQFGVVVKEQISTEADDAIRSLLSSVTSSLEKKGFPASKLQGMEEKAVEKIVEKALNQEIERKLKKAEYKWAYKSGSLSVKGEVGHFAFEQEVSIGWLAKSAALGTAAASGYKVVYSKNSFVQVKTCIDNFCVDLDSKNRLLRAGAEPASSPLIGQTK